MLQLRAVINSNFFFPIIILYYGIFYILMGERTIVNEGLGVDGLVYAQVAMGNLDSELINNYTVTRIFPAYIVHLVMESSSISYTTSNIISTFEALNLLLLTLSVYYLKKIFIILKLNLKIQLLGFILFTANIAVLKFSFYCPVGTDTDALFLGTMLVYFYLKNSKAGVLIISLITCFTWPLIAYQGIAMFLFPMDASINYPSVKAMFFHLIRSVSVLFALVFLGYYVFYKQQDIEALFCLRINKQLVYLSSAIVLYVFYHFAEPFINGQLYYKFIRKLKEHSFYLRLLIVVFSALAVGFAYKQLIVDTAPSQFLSLERMLGLSFLFSVVRPGFAIISHFAYFAMLPVLLIFFWKSFSRSISSYGPGIVLGFTMYLYLMGIMCETRLITPLLPFFVIFLLKGINEYKFSDAFYVLFGIMALIASKIWLTMDYRATAGIDEDGCRDIPDQLLLMNFGPWMSEKMYYIQGAAMILFSVILFFTLYKIEFIGTKELRIKRRF